MPYNLLTCGGFERTGTGYITGGACMTGRMGLVLLFFIIAIMRKWLGEEGGMPFSFMFALIGGLGGYIVVLTIIGIVKWAFLVGLIGALAGGFLGGLVVGGEE